MTQKRIKPSASQRTVKRLQEQIDALGDHKARMREDLAKYKFETGKIMDAALSRNEYLSDILTNNNVKITELEQQVANQYQECSALRQDLEKYGRLYNERTERCAAQRTQMDAMEMVEISLRMELDEARTKLRYRFYQWVVVSKQRLAYRLNDIGAWFATRKERVVNRWKIRRLNRARVAAITEAGYIPQNLVKIAQHYYEADMQRLREDERIEQTVYYADRENRTVRRRPSLGRRIQIWLGRA